MTRALPASAADLIPSIGIDALLTQRDAAVAQLATIATAVAAYREHEHRCCVAGAKSGGAA
jgi:hypothetical protein